VLAIDGGGIYGLTSARWLRRLCEQEPSFLSGEDVQLFAGCSSGAVNSLLLAKHEKPREAVLSGELEDFWHDPGTFTNSNPTGQMLSWLELSGWFGEKDFLDLLVRHFGDRTLGDLKQRVLISTFNWGGAPPVFPPLEEAREKVNSAAAPPSFATLFQELAKGFFPQQGAKVPTEAQIAGDRRRWHPEMFSNAEGSPQRRFRVADIAYGAATPPGFRALRGGIGDGASFSASPPRSTRSLISWPRSGARAQGIGRPTGRSSTTCSTASLCSRWETGRTAPIISCPTTTWASAPGQGPHEPRPRGDLGAQLVFAPARGSRSDADRERAARSRLFRLNAPIMDVPTVVAAYIARWPSYRKWLLQHIEQATKTELSEAGVADALRFLRSEEWLAERGPKTP
jgi:hypothetical protein